MSTRIAINGFGRIGRLVFRALHEQGLFGKEVEVVAVGDIVPADNLAYLLKYDSIQRKFDGHGQLEEVGLGQGSGRRADSSTARTCWWSAPSRPAELPWKQLGVDYVIESTGLFTDAEKAKGHLAAGAKKVIISAPAKGEDITVVMGVNHEKYDAGKHNIVSNASCTTNCLAPVVHVVLKEGFGLTEGLMTTVHSYTATQKTVDGPSRKDWKGGRSAAINIIPSSTGAAKAVALVLPEVKGKLSGHGVPRADADGVGRRPDVQDRQVDVSIKELNAAMKSASESYLKGILGYTEDEVVSSDFIHDERSSASTTPAARSELNANFFKLVSWYDNEWGYSHRCVDLLTYMIKKRK